MFIHQKKIIKKRKFILVKKAGMILALLFFSLSLNNISGTNSFFTDTAKVKGITFEAGVWIPTVTMTVNPTEPDGEDDSYSEPPCVKLFSDIEDVTLYYSFEADEDSEGTVAEDICFYPPQGESTLTAWAVNDENDDWVSAEIQAEFKVGTEIKLGDVVINELMWMGSLGEADDEWIELRNMTDEDIDLSNWDITYGGSGKNGHIEIPHGYSIKANEYFLIVAKKYDETDINLDKDRKKYEGYTHVSGMNLKNDGETLILKNKNKKIIDTAWQDKKWPDGWHGIFLHMSMERDDEPGDGTLDSSWHTCVDRKCNDETYWREEGFNFGTPGKKNSTRDKIIIPGCHDFEEIILNLLNLAEDKSDEKDNSPKIESPIEDKSNNKEDKKEEILLDETLPTNTPEEEPEDLEAKVTEEIEPGIEKEGKIEDKK